MSDLALQRQSVIVLVLLRFFAESVMIRLSLNRLRNASESSGGNSMPHELRRAHVICTDNHSDCSCPKQNVFKMRPHAPECEIGKRNLHAQDLRAMNNVKEHECSISLSHAAHS